MLAAAGRPVEAGTLDALAGVVAIAIERALLEEQAGELTRQSEQLNCVARVAGSRSTDPLTAIGVAASNIRESDSLPRTASNKAT